MIRVENTIFQNICIYLLNSCSTSIVFVIRPVKNEGLILDNRVWGTFFDARYTERIKLQKLHPELKYEKLWLSIKAVHDEILP